MKIPAHRRLRTLPEVFTTATLAAQLNGDTKAASVYLARWRREGLIAPLGPRAGVHFNLVRDPDAETNYRAEAIAYVLPGAVVAGASALHAAGWITQIPAALEIMVPGRASTPEIHGVISDTRPVTWFILARQHLQRPGPLPLLAPSFALADLCGSGGWCPDPDDLEWDLVDEERLRAAFSELDVPLPEAWDAELSGQGGDFTIT